jgi:hypothetical protein
VQTQPAPAPGSTEQAATARTPPLVVVLGVLGRVWCRWLPVLLIGFGVAVRLRQYLSHRSLWLDEALIALNVLSRGYDQLLKPLWFQQAAPVGWLWAERSAVDLFGRSEAALRLVALAAGIATLLAIWWAARRLLSAWLVPVAVAAAASVPYLLYYSNEVKQYELDAAMALLLLLASLPLLQDQPSWPRLLIWSLLGAAAVWCSHPAVLVLGGYSATLAARHLRRRHWKTLLQVGGGGLLWGASFLTVYLVSLRPVAKHNGSLYRYWQSGFTPRPLTPSAAIGWLGRRWAEFVHNPLGLAPVPAVSIAVLLGGAALLVHRRPQALLLLSPVPVFVAAAAARAYPLQGRLLLVLVPTALLLAAAAPDWHGPRIALAGRVAGAVLLGVLLWAPTGRAIGLLGHPTTVEEVRPVLQAIHDRQRPGDLLWVYRGGIPAVRYYAPTTGVSPTGIMWLARPTGPCDPRTTIRRAAGGHRVWLVFGHHFSFAPRNEPAIVLSRMDLAGTRASAIHAPGASAYLYDLAGPPTDPTGTHVLRARPPQTCLRIGRF